MMTKLNPYAWFAQVFVPGFYLAGFAAAAGIVAIAIWIWERLR